ncbi:phosphoglycerate mutase, 2,3-bisphosphoglycerate- independent [Desulfofarcimen acetoxidans DSM 771]|uniref:2,3-bisphosphoglycerate-independent phosphoglycerate mutase n=1 Tax=Desulfofarcimen acetoxidans (strain ATCC 49208 / DSM 771 / KCTC 5769 / VKM B-1644 / 5575) TaxID=485916 RepID=C8VXZ8_DESAS|nr:2,3-bisphosphoglycerate-independent phosphoglycerate mutase [Desulfofarcimen acetoxidans]ACV64627.1 phosphoglycerate mutase, 2,3-bisphosphoglycerate- independent [Desulfofarcimen acetoxidans DSM 771]
MAAAGPVVLVILDGWGLCEDKRGNAIACARKPNMDGYWAKYPHSKLVCSGEDVGLPHGQMGNSEVGHLNMGAGRVVYQELTRITRAIKDGSFFQNAEFLKIMDKIKQAGSSLHLMGLLSDGGVHSHIDHLFALLELAGKEGLEKVSVHVFLDGRDVPPDNAKEYIMQLQNKIKELGIGEIATVSGRYYAMDRDRRWERVARAYEAMVYGRGQVAPNPIEAVDQSYGKEKPDEFVEPTVILKDNGEPVAVVSDNDGIIFYNFRPDRAREITRAFVDKDFSGFDRGNGHPKVEFLCMTQYDRTIDAPVAYMPQVLKNTLGEVLSRHGISQLRLAETEKYAHVTFFFNGGVEVPNPGEERILIASPKVATYDLQPEMSAGEVTDVFLEQIRLDKFKVVIMNYANPDMVGHTGDMKAAVRAVETVDGCLGRLVEAVLEKDGVVLITADHGNAEHMMDEKGNPFTAHTTDPVPFLLIGEAYSGVSLRQGRLEDIAPTILQLLDIAKPEEMTGESLIVL